MEENFAKRAAQHGSHVGLSDEEGLSASSQDHLSHILKHREASPNLIMDQFDVEHRDQLRHMMMLE